MAWDFQNEHFLGFTVEICMNRRRRKMYLKSKIKIIGWNDILSTNLKLQESLQIHKRIYSFLASLHPMFCAFLCSVCASLQLKPPLFSSISNCWYRYLHFWFKNEDRSSTFESGFPNNKTDIGTFVFHFCSAWSKSNSKA